MRLVIEDKPPPPDNSGDGAEVWLEVQPPCPLRLSWGELTGQGGPATGKGSGGTPVTPG